MPRTPKRQLQFHKASSRWCKRYTDPKTGKKPCVYLGPGTPTRDGKGRQDELYDRALREESSGVAGEGHMGNVGINKK